MQESFFNSSDAVRGVKPLLHARQWELKEALRLEAGGVLERVNVVYETYGQLNAAGNNAILICHALTGDSHVAAHDSQDDPGWWDIVVGPDKAIDTDRYFVICPNILGGCRGTTGPNSTNPATGKPYGADFPFITVGDIVQVQCRLIDHLGVQVLHAVVGGSLGGQMVLDWAVRYPSRLRAAVAIATSTRLSSQALAFDIVGRNAILSDPHFQAGQYYDTEAKPAVGLAIARMLGHITYLSREAMTRKFDADRLAGRAVKGDFETTFAVGSYLAYQGHRFVERFDPNSYVAITLAMDHFDMGDTPKAIAAALKDATCRWLVLSYSTDWLFPPIQSRNMVDALVGRRAQVSYCQITSDCGHDAFLLPNDLEQYGEMIRAFLDQLGTDGSAATTPRIPLASAGHPSSPTSIFHSRRIDLDSIAELIAPGASVLDLGCGGGELLSLLRQRGHKRLVGIERDPMAILECLRRGLDVVGADLDGGLGAFGDNEFDLVILSQTLQSVKNVASVLDDMLRIGQRCIVSFPNFAHRALREQLYSQGRAPTGRRIARSRLVRYPQRAFSVADRFRGILPGAWDQH